MPTSSAEALRHNAGFIVATAEQARQGEAFLQMLETAASEALLQPENAALEQLAFDWIVASVAGLDSLPSVLIDSVRFSLAVQVAEVVAQRVRGRTYH